MPVTEPPAPPTSTVPPVSTAQSQLVRHVNSRTVLDVFWESDVLTVTDLMAATGLTRVTVHAVCNDLVRMGWVGEREIRRAASGQPGRPSKQFQLNHQAAYVLGIDMGDTSTTALLADLRGNPIGKHRRHGLPPLASAQQRVEHAGAVVAELLEQTDVAAEQVLTAGVGLAAPVSKDGRTVGLGPAHTNPYWVSFRIDIAELQAALAGIPPLIGNDANLAALAEYRRGAAVNIDTFVTLLAGERLGAGVMEAGRLLYGVAGGAGEMYFLERFLSGGGADGIGLLARTWAGEAVSQGRDTLLSDPSWRGADELTAPTVFAAAAAGDAVATEVLDQLAERLALLIGVMSTFLNPELVVIGGAVAEAAQVLLKPIAQRLEKVTYSPPRIVCSTLGDAIVVEGAVSLALEHVRKHALERTPAAK
jgi:predicted NBD/HSP70 family sugar kinase